MERESDYQHENFLVVDDEEAVGNVVKSILTSLGFHAHYVEDARTALDQLRHGHYSFLLTDISMPDLNGIDLIKMVSKEIPDISIIAMTGYDKDYTYMDVVKAGASDFIVKPFKIDEIEAKVARILRERTIREKLAKMSITDNLTGLYNQRHFYNKLQEEIERANRQNHNLSLIILDLDHFKAYNDNHGHLAGDGVLSRSGKIIQSNIRDSVDIAFRYGGDEFAVILVEADEDIVRSITERLKMGFEEMREISASIGYATYSSDMKMEDLIKEADGKLYHEKASWRLVQKDKY
ncbi:MAG: diguanylate cyclase [Thermodesulfobacteriota bacterium]